MAKLVKADPVIEVGHVKENRNDSSVVCCVVFRHKGSFEGYLQTLCSRNCTLPRVFLLNIAGPSLGLVTADPAP